MPRVSDPRALESLPDPLPADPLPLLVRWLDDATRALGEDANPTAMTLATAGSDGAPDARVVLCRGVDALHGALSFYTDRSSTKGRQLGENPRAAAVFYWDPLHRQLRARGPILPTSDADSDAYFAGRPLGSRISASVSLQSRPLGSRQALERAHAELARSAQQSGSVARPERWGGFRLWIEELELWLGRPDRLHERALYRRRLERAGDEYKGSPWTATRLQP
jgi:pyridoxamine 5'-phosphate oxidase